MHGFRWASLRLRIFGGPAVYHARNLDFSPVDIMTHLVYVIPRPFTHIQKIMVVGQLTCLVCDACTTKPPYCV